MDKTTQELIDAGNEILKSVSDAIDRNDYSNLANEISKTIKTVSIDRKTTYASGRTNQSTYTYRTAPVRRAVQYPFLQKRISKYNGLAELLVGGFFGLFLALPIFISMAATGHTVGIVIGGVLTAITTFMSLRGFKKLKLAGKLHLYGNILKDAEYFKISDLAKVAVKTDAEVLKDIKDLIKAGYVPRAKLDASETTCMITDTAYQMYLGAEKDRLEREKRELETQRTLEEVNRTPGNATSQSQDILTEGEDYVRFVRGINDIISDSDEMSDKLYRLENIMNRIFDQVKKDPSSADELHKLMNYYLPTIRKLLTAYVELDKQPEVGDNITKTKKEIYSAMDMINEAFENLLDSLFQDMAWDISSDISVMRTMMAQDGLTGEGQGVAAQMQMKP